MTSVLRQFLKISISCENQYKRSLEYAIISKEMFLCQILQNCKMRKSFTRIGVSVWNFIPLSVKTLNINNFCKK